MRLLQREDHVHMESSGYANSSQRSGGLNLHEELLEKWIKIEPQEIVFDGEKCLLLNFRDVSAGFKLKKRKEKIRTYRKLHKLLHTVTLDPFNKISVLTSWLLQWH